MAIEIVDLLSTNSDFAILNGKINYFYGHFLCRELLIYQRVNVEPPAFCSDHFLNRKSHG